MSIRQKIIYNLILLIRFILRLFLCVQLKLVNLSDMFMKIFVVIVQVVICVSIMMVMSVV